MKTKKKQNKTLVCLARRTNTGKPRPTAKRIASRSRARRLRSWKEDTPPVCAQLHELVFLPILEADDGKAHGLPSLPGAPRPTAGASSSGVFSSSAYTQHARCHAWLPIPQPGRARATSPILEHRSRTGGSVCVVTRLYTRTTILQSRGFPVGGVGKKRGSPNINAKLGFERGYPHKSPRTEHCNQARVVQLRANSRAARKMNETNVRRNLSLLTDYWGQAGPRTPPLPPRKKRKKKQPINALHMQSARHAAVAPEERAAPRSPT